MTVHMNHPFLFTVILLSTLLNPRVIVASAPTDVTEKEVVVDINTPLTRWLTFTAFAVSQVLTSYPVPSHHSICLQIGHWPVKP